MIATVAQLAEQGFRKAQVGGSSPLGGSKGEIDCGTNYRLFF